MGAAPFDQSLWYATAAAAPETARLEDRVETDVCVVGGGYTGLSTALHLAEAGVRVVLLEAAEIGFGGSGRNAGHCTPTFHFHEIPTIRRLLGEPWASRFIRLQCDAANLVFELIRRHAIDCEAVQSGYVHAAHSPRALAKLEAKNEDYQALGKQTRLLDRHETEQRTGSPRYHGAWFHPEGGHLNPLGYARGLARAAKAQGARLFTRSPAVRLEREGGRWRVETPAGGVVADKVVCGTGAYSSDYWPGLTDSFTKLRVGVLATQPLSANLRGSILPADNTLVDTRGDPFVVKLNAEGRLVTSVFVEGRRGGDRAYTEPLRRSLLQWTWPQLDEVRWDYYWFGDLDMQPRTIPRLFKLAPGVMASLGYSGRGVPTGTAMGSVLADWARGVPVGELALEPEPLTRAPAYMAVAPRAFLAYARLKDRLTSSRRDLPPMRKEVA